MDEELTNMLQEGFLNIREQKNEALETLGIVSRIVNLAIHSVSREDVVQQILRILLEETRFDNVSILLYDQSANCLRLKAAAGVWDILAEQNQKTFNKDLSFGPGPSIAWQIFESQNPVFIQDCSQYHIANGNNAVIKPGCLACLPLAKEGVLNLSASQPRDILPYQRRELVILANIIANLLQSTTLKQELEDHRKNLEKLVELKTKDVLAANKNLKSTLSHLEAIVRNNPEGICLLDGQGRVIMANPRFLFMLGAAPSEIMNNTLEHIFQNPVHYQTIQQAISKKESVRFSDIPVTKTDGQNISIDIFLHPIADQLKQDAQTDCNYMVMFHDLTEQKKMAEKMLQSEKLSALGAMAGGIAHDFNNILTIIMGNAELLLKETMDPKARKRLENILTAATDGAYIVRRIQNYTRLHQKDTSKAAYADVNAIIEDTIRLLEPKWKAEYEKQGIPFVVELDLSQVEPAAINPTDLREVLINLFLNAIEAMPKGGTLTISTTLKGNNIVIEITDTGTGIPDELKKRIFDPFFTTKGPQSSGLGLSVTYGIIMQAGGEIQVKSQPGQGTTFTISLPAAINTLTPNTLKDIKAKKQPPKGVTILTVDDEPDIAEMIQMAIESLGYTATALTDPRKAISEIESGKYTLLITDLGMPHLTGWDLAQKAKEHGIPAILLTGWGYEYEGQDLKAKGVEAVISKPVKLDQLSDAITSVLSSSKNTP